MTTEAYPLYWLRTGRAPIGIGAIMHVSPPASRVLAMRLSTRTNCLRAYVQAESEIMGAQHVSQR